MSPWVKVFTSCGSTGMITPMARMSSSTVTKMKPRAARRRPSGGRDPVTSPPISDTSASGWAGVRGGSAMGLYTRARHASQTGVSPPAPIGKGHDPRAKELPLTDAANKACKLGEPLS